MKRVVPVPAFFFFFLAYVGFGCSSSHSNPITASSQAEENKSPQEIAFFEEITPSANIDFTPRNGEEADQYTILESLGSGVAAIDYDGDGLMDLYFVGGGFFSGADKKNITGLGGKLYRNCGNGLFRDVTIESGLDKLAGGAPWFYAHGVAVSDYDCDGYPDLLVLGWRHVALFHNEKGQKFVDVTRSSHLDQGILWGVSAAWADLDGDGWPDLYICQYLDWSWQKHPVDCIFYNVRDICPPNRFHGLTHKVFRNLRNGQFADVSDTCGLVQGAFNLSKGLGVVAVDVNGDRKPDLYVANDDSGNFLYINKSTPGTIQLEEVGVTSRTARDERGKANGSMGVDAADYDGCGKPSLWVTNFEKQFHSLYHNECTPTNIFFQYQTLAAGISRIGYNYVGWGTGFADFDLDGDEDIFITNGHVQRFPSGAGVTRKQKPVLFANQGNGTFNPVSHGFGSYGEQGHNGRGAALVDLDNDGRIDLAISHVNEPVALLKNIYPEHGHWLGLRLQGRAHCDLVGGRIVCQTSDKTQTRFLKGGGSFASSSDTRIVFGLGGNEHYQALTVFWPDGSSSDHPGLAMDRYHTIVQKGPDIRK